MQAGKLRRSRPQDSVGAFVRPRLARRAAERSCESLAFAFVVGLALEADQPGMVRAIASKASAEMAVRIMKRLSRCRR